MHHPPRLLVIDPSVIFPEEEGVRTVVGDWPGEVGVMRPALDGSPLPPSSLADCAGVILMGSAASVHDDRPWLKELSTFLTPVLRGQLPVALLGICFGHQMIGHLLGAQVGFVHHDHHRESGLRSTRIEGSHLIDGERELSIMASHMEHLLELPLGCRRTAHRQSVPFDAIEHEDLPIFGVQFHPEARHSFAIRRNVDISHITEQYLESMDALLGRFRRIALGLH